MGITKQAVRGLEKREAGGSLTLKSLNEAARALDMKLVYAIIPIDGDIDQYLEEAAGKAARKIVMRTHQNMKLEGQETPPHVIKAAIEEMTIDLKRNLDRTIWA
jgi:predicted DNA-binding mobile mystery protein A